VNFLSLEGRMALLQSPNFFNCSTQSISPPKIGEAKIRSLTATSAFTSFQYISAGQYSNNGGVAVPAGLQYCNVTIAYSPPESERITTVQIWLPLKWNDRLQGVGGGGWSAGLNSGAQMTMMAAVAQGYTAIGTDGGYATTDPRDWAFEGPPLPHAPAAATQSAGPRKIDKKAMKHYASTSLKDLSVLGKTVIQNVYGRAPKYSYWNGCSHGG
jgi:hypothetical protein